VQTPTNWDDEQMARFVLVEELFKGRKRPVETVFKS
jgi:hypothetical protein